MLQDSQDKPITTKDINSAIVELQKIKAALAELRSNGYRIDRSTAPGSRTRYLLRAVSRRPAKSNVKTCQNHPWRPAKDGGLVLAQPEMEKRRSPLVSIPPFGRGFPRHEGFRYDDGEAAREARSPRCRSCSR